MTTSHPAPIYTAANCGAAYQLDWTLSVFWRQDMNTAGWLEALQQATEPDDVRILQHRFAGPRVSQFLLSTKPEVAPAQFVRSVKGRVQHLLRSTHPRAFRRNYGFRSVGSVTRAVIEQYVGSQLTHHRMADTRVQESLAQFQYCGDVCLSRPRQGGHAIYWYNLHLVLINESRYMEIRESELSKLRETILEVSAKRGHLLSRAGIVPDHVHLVLGCDAQKSPSDVALCYMNNLAYAFGMKAIFKFSYYTGTCGEYDLGVIPRELEAGLP